MAKKFNESDYYIDNIEIITKEYTKISRMLQQILKSKIT